MSDTASKLNVTRFFTLGVDDVLGTVTYEKRRSVIKDPDGTVVFSLNDASIPSTWSQLATDIVVAKYFRKGGLFGDPSKGETGVRQVIDRIADPISKWAWSHGYVTSEVDRDNLRAELSYMLVNQIGAHNSPVWFNMGLSEKYQIKGSGGTWSVYDEAGTPRSEFKAGLTLDSYARPQTSACFIQSIKDNLVGPGGIFATLHTEAIIFKYGSGTGTNFSALRGKNEKLSGGGTSSGLMSYLEVFDRAAGSTKSGGVTRRAAKMVCLDLDHPEIIDFIECKLKEEKKVAALIAAGYPSDFNGDAYHTVAFQNANHSVRIPDSFFHALDANKKWSTHFRTTGGVCEELEASQLWQRLVHAAWACADPGVHYETTINDWHTVPNSAPIEASNPCSEYLHISDSACNLASLNLTKFLHSSEDGSPFFNVESYQKAVELFLLTQDILVDMASYPTEAIAQNSHDFRPLGLGYANLGTLLMMLGAPYDSDVGRSIAASVTAILTGTAYAMSAKIAKVKGPFAKFEHNREPMLRVMCKHQEAANNISVEGSTTVAWRIAARLKKVAVASWEEAVQLGELYGYRNSQASVLAPTGTIGLLMDCDTTGVEPDFALVKFKKLAGGGSFKIANQAVGPALKNLGYAQHEISAMLTHLTGTNRLPDAVADELMEKGYFTADSIVKINAALPGAFSLEMAFNPNTIGSSSLTEAFGLVVDKPISRVLLGKLLDLKTEQLDALEQQVLGHYTLEGAPYLKAEHLPVFDCANRCGKNGTRYLHYSAHLRMMAAAQPFLSGAISKTVNLPSDATESDVAAVYRMGWELGLKAVALYRDGCKASQPLSTSGSTADPSIAPAERQAMLSIRDMIARASDNEIAEVQKALLQHPIAEKVRVDHFGVLQPKRGREKMPSYADGGRYSLTVGGQKVWLKTFFYDDGRLGEVWLETHKDGSPIRALLNQFAMSVSLGLQHGVPLRDYVDMFTLTEYRPGGPVTGHKNVRFCNSITDAAFRILAVDVLGDDDLAQNKLTDEERADILGEHAEEGPMRYVIPVRSATVDTIAPVATLSADSPACDNCGHPTVRNGSCFRCHNCGTSMGCS